MRMRKIILLVLVSALVLTLPGPVYSLTIKMGSVAQPGSIWDEILKKVGREWEKITGGKVTLEIYPGGTVGSESDMIRKMRRGKLGGAAFFNRGMPHICPDTYVFIVPLLTTSEAEHDYVFNKMKPLFEKKIEEQGFKVITWSLSGWLKLFSKNPIFYPGDLQKHKLSFTTWNAKTAKVWRDHGLRLVPTDFKDLEMALESGMVNAFFLSPLVAFSGRYFTLAPNMCAQTVSPLYWSIVLTAETWEQVPGRYKKQMEETAQKLSKELYEDVIKREKEALAQMEVQDLIINKLPADALEKWQAVLGKGLEALIGAVFSKEVYRQVQQYKKEYRESKEN